MTQQTFKITKRTLGHSDLEVPAIGLGCMSFANIYGRADEDESIATLHHAIDIGINFFDTAELYGAGSNEEMIGQVLKERRDEVVIATKFGLHWDNEAEELRPNSHPDYICKACDASLQRLGIETIDLYYQHRVDPNVPIEEVFGILADLVQAGKVRHVGVSEATPEQIRRAHSVIPLSALQTEYSLWSREPEDGILQTTRELGITFVAYSPLGRGFLANRYASPQEMEAGDWRLTNPRFTQENFEKNLPLLNQIKEMAAMKGITPAQLALAWVIAQGEDIVTIPGTKHRRYLEQNTAAMSIMLTEEDLATLNEIATQHIAAGARY